VMNPKLICEDRWIVAAWRSLNCLERDVRAVLLDMSSEEIPSNDRRRIQEANRPHPKA
jgi:hypothetical protein